MDNVVTIDSSLKEMLKQIDQIKKTSSVLVLKTDSIGRNCHIMKTIVEYCQPCFISLFLDEFNINLLNNPLICQILEQVNEVYVNKVLIDMKKLIKDFRLAKQKELSTVALALATVI